MRLFLLPISTRRTLIYCDKHFGRRVPKLLPNSAQTSSAETTAAQTSSTQKTVAQRSNAETTAAQTSEAQPTEKQPANAPAAPSQLKPQVLLDRLTTKAASTWTDWERAPSGWKKTLTGYGNALLRRIPYQEWGLKSFPPLTPKKRETALARSGTRISVLFPGRFLPQNEVLGVLGRLSSERQDLHRRRMWGCLVGAPLTLPFALVPIVPNIPGFYLLYRAYSHYRALYGARHLGFLVENKLVEPVPSTKLDELYAAGRLEISATSVSQTAEKQLAAGEVDVMLLNNDSGALISEAFETKEMGVEIERAVEQVEKLILGASAQDKNTGEDNEKAKK